MKANFYWITGRGIIMALAILSMLTISNQQLSAALLDNFDDNELTGWRFRSINFGDGAAAAQDGELRVTSQAEGWLNVVYLVHNLCDPEGAYTIIDGQTVEFRVDLVSANQNQAVALVSFNLDGAYPFTAGYTISKDEDFFGVSKDGNVFFSRGPGAIKNNNVTLVLSLTGQGTSVLINAQVLDKDNGNQVLSEIRGTDTSAGDSMLSGSDIPPQSYLGAKGYFTLGLFHGENSLTVPSEVIFDNAQVTVTGPSLSVEQLSSSDTVRLTWPITQSPFNLETAPSLGGMDSWQPVSIPSQQQEGQNVVDLEVNDGPAYFRLRLE